MKREQPWLKIRRAFNCEPIVSYQIKGNLNIYVERYLCHSMNASLPALPTVTLATQFGGSKIIEGQQQSEKNAFFPSISAILPKHCPTEWQFRGFSDFAIFYLPETSSNPFCQLIEELCKEKDQLILANSSLVAETAKQISQELFHYESNSQFVERLLLVMLEQTCKILNNDCSIEITPNYGQLGRIQNIISYIQAHLDQSLTIEHLAAHLKLSPSHFRRLFREAMGTSIHQFIAQMRLKKSCELLSNSDMPLVQISETLGFSSQSHFTTSFKTYHAVTPARYRQLFKT